MMYRRGTHIHIILISKENEIQTTEVCRSPLRYSGYGPQRTWLTGSGQTAVFFLSAYCPEVNRVPVQCASKIADMM
jgi:hypothetical protein